MVNPWSKFLNFKRAGSVMHIKTKFTITTMRLKARLGWLVRPGHGRRLGTNSSVQDLAVSDRPVHSELSGVVACSVLMAVYHCFITHQITTRSRARVNPRLCAALVIFANKRRHTVLFINSNQIQCQIFRLMLNLHRSCVACGGSLSLENGAGNSNFVNFKNVT